MNAAMTVLSLVAFVLLTAGTAVFVAAEFSLTALERSTVEANVRSGDRRDQMVQRAHRTLSTQLSGAQVGISITTLATGFLAEPVVARLIAPGLTALGLPDQLVSGVALALATPRGVVRCREALLDGQKCEYPIRWNTTVGRNSM